MEAGDNLPSTNKQDVVPFAYLYLLLNGYLLLYCIAIANVTCSIIL